MTPKEWIPLAVTLFFNLVTIAIPLGTRLVDLSTQVALQGERLEQTIDKVRELNEQLKQYNTPPRFTSPSP